MKNKFVKMTAAVLAGMMLLTGCGQSAGSTDVENGSTTQEPADAEQENKADNTASGDKVKIEYWHCNAETQGGLTVDELVKNFNEENDHIEVVAKYNPDAESAGRDSSRQYTGAGTDWMGFP